MHQNCTQDKIQGSSADSLSLPTLEESTIICGFSYCISVVQTITGNTIKYRKLSQQSFDKTGVIAFVLAQLNNKVSSYFKDVFP